VALAGEWSADDSIKLKLDSKGKGTCDSKGRTYVKFSKKYGLDIIGDIDVAKAEIPGVF